MYSSNLTCSSARSPLWCDQATNPQQSCCSGGRAQFASEAASGPFAERNGTLFMCPCGDASPNEEEEDTTYDRGYPLMVAHLSGLMILLTAAFFLCRQIARSRRLDRRTRGVAERPRRRPTGETARQAREAQAVLVAVGPSDELCAVCMEPLDDDVVRPPACSHLYHRACIHRWIDQVNSDAMVAAASDAAAKRMLSCPVCARPIVPGGGERRGEGSDLENGDLENSDLENGGLDPGDLEPEPESEPERGGVELVVLTDHRRNDDHDE
mmetsp:Transcript_4188/g.13774  ORF Transcript_4188/g.13774 Transcript_4188/m.13774 type:complete len:268 (-) Transcript_4188:288-1091(-)